MGSNRLFFAQNRPIKTKTSLGTIGFCSDLQDYEFPSPYGQVFELPSGGGSIEVIYNDNNHQFINYICLDPKDFPDTVYISYADRYGLPYQTELARDKSGRVKLEEVLGNVIGDWVVDGEYQRFQIDCGVSSWKIISKVGRVEDAIVRRIEMTLDSTDLPSTVKQWDFDTYGSLHINNTNASWNSTPQNKIFNVQNFYNDSLVTYVGNRLINKTTESLRYQIQLRHDKTNFSLTSDLLDPTPQTLYVYAQGNITSDALDDYNGGITIKVSLGSWREG